MTRRSGKERAAGLGVLALLALALAAACAPAAAPPPTSEPLDGTLTIPPQSSQPVFQVIPASLSLSTDVGRARSVLPAVPRVTLWSDGCVVFWGTPGGDAAIREGHLDETTVAAILDAASALYDLDDTYSYVPSPYGPSFDSAPATMSVETDRGRKTVTSYSASLEGTSYPGAQTDPHVEVLRRVYQRGTASLPLSAPPLQPAEVVVLTFPPGGMTRETALRLTHGEWPSRLVGHLRGQEAREAVELAGLFGSKGSQWYRSNGEAVAIVVWPVLPLLHLPSPVWPQGGLPRHPAATADNTPGLPYRFSGVTQAEVAAWYRDAMPKARWRLVKSQGDSIQVWLRERYFNDPIVRLSFGPESFLIELVTMGDGVPVHPRAGEGHCMDGPCQQISGVSPSAAEAWFREHLVYLGWQETQPNVYRRGKAQVRLLFRAGEDGTEFFQEYTSPRTMPPYTPLIGRLGPGPDLVLIDRYKSRSYPLQPGCAEVEEALQGSVGKEVSIVADGSLLFDKPPLMVLAVNTGGSNVPRCGSERSRWPPSPPPPRP